MIKTQRGAANGIDIIEYKEGKTYDLPSIFYEKWIERGQCKPFIEKEVEENMFIPELENKMVHLVDKTKLEKLKNIKILGVSNKKLAEELNVTINELKELKKQLKV